MTDEPQWVRLVRELAHSEELVRAQGRMPVAHAEARMRFLARAEALGADQRAQMKATLARVDVFVLEQLTPLFGPRTARRALDLAAGTGRALVGLAWSDAPALGVGLARVMRPIVGPAVADEISERLTLGAELWRRTCAA